MEHDFVLEWFRFADRDLNSAEYLFTMHPQPYEIICYLCQQSVEKHLKGYLIFKGITEPPKIHNLETLNDLCKEYDELFEANSKLCSILTPYGVQPRYPNEIHIEEHHMQKALEYAKQIKDFAPLQAVKTELKKTFSDETPIAEE